MFNKITMFLICGSLNLKWSRSAIIFHWVCYSRHCPSWAVAGASSRHEVTSQSCQGFWHCTNAWWRCLAVQRNKHHFWCLTAKSFMSDFLWLGTLTHSRATQWEWTQRRRYDSFCLFNIVAMKLKFTLSVFKMHVIDLTVNDLSVHVSFFFF